MGYLTLGILGFSALALLFGMLVGCLRGRNRAILRLGLLLLTVVLAFALRGVVYDTLAETEIELDGKMTTLPAYMTEMIAESFDGNAPASVTNLALALTEILVGLVAFYMLFIVLRLITWLIVFPICKIFVKKGAKRRRGFGALIGLAQGALIALVICAPITGLLVQTDKLSKVEMNGEALFELPPELGVEEYLASAPGTVYNKAGGWLFNMLTTVKTESGTKVSIEDTCDILEKSTVIVEKIEQLTEKIEGITDAAASAENQIDALKGVGDALVEIGNSLDSLSGDAQGLIEEMIGDLASTMIGEDADELPPAVSDMLENFDFEEMDLAAAGEALNSIASVIEKDGSAPITSDEASAIVNGFAANDFLLDLIVPEGEEPETLIMLPANDAATVDSAIASSSLSAEQKHTLRTLLGLS